MPATHFRIETATDAAGDGIAALIAAVFTEYEDCPFVESEYSELTAVSQYYHALDGEIWIATSQMDQDVADAMGGGRIVGCLAIVPTLQADVCELFKMYVARDATGFMRNQDSQNSRLFVIWEMLLTVGNICL